MYTFYFIALLPVLVGAALWVLREEVNWIEWLGASLIGFILAGIFHGIAIYGVTADTETWSGQITRARQFSAWKEYYEYAVYRTEFYTESETYTDSKGRSQTRMVTRSRQVFDHWEPTTRWHNEYFECYSNIDTSYSINKAKYMWFTSKPIFDNIRAVQGDRRTGEHNSRMIMGDPNDYVSDNKTGYIVPVTKSVSFSNRLKAAPSVFSFVQPPQNVQVFDYPSNPNPFESQRVLGEAHKFISINEWDKLNARLGIKKKVNLVIIGYKNKSSDYAEYQKAKYIGGKKNDVIITFNIDNNDKVMWVKSFGWTDSKYCLANIDTLLLSTPINNDILPLLEQEIEVNYKIKNWHDFDYIAIEPSSTYYVWFVIILIIVEGGYFYWCLTNMVDKDDTGEVQLVNIDFDKFK